jgi:hypothetical protein
MIEELDKLRHETFMDGLINSAYEKIPTFGPNGDQSTKDKRILDKIIDDPKIKKEFERKYKTTKELKD